MIVRERLSADVHQELLTRIIQGQLAPGQRIRDSELAEDLGVSRTPVREALLRLEREGFISAQKHFGFSVKALAESEIREIYPLVRLLECSSLDEAPLPGPLAVERLARLAKGLPLAGKDPLKRIELDSSWHEALIEGDANSHRRRILSELKGILFRYEYGFMQHDELVSSSALEHQRVVEALSAGDKGRAVSLLATHWDRCVDATLADFRRRGAGPAREGGRE